MLLVWSPSGGFPPAFAGQDLVSSIDGHIERLEARFDIPIKYKDVFPASSDIQYSLIPPEEYRLLNDYLDLFEDEINKYPPGFFKRRHLTCIVLVERLFKGETPVEGMYNSGRRVMLFDILRSDRNQSLQRHSIHHEIFHMMAQQLLVFGLLDDGNWAALNSRDFVYGKQNRSSREQNPVNRFAPNQLGFVTDYAMQSVAEDQAEVFACLMQKEHKRLIEAWQKNDEILRRKIQAIKEFVVDYDSEMDEAYWRRLSIVPPETLP